MRITSSNHLKAEHMRNIIALAIFTAFGSQINTQFSITSGSVSINQEVMTINGAITPQLAKDFRAIFNPALQTTIVINSEGGHTQAAMELAESIYGKGITLIVNKQCLSACADPLFLAAEKKIILPNSIVGWHGGGMRRSKEITEMLEDVHLDNKMRKEALWYVHQLKTQYEFLKKIGVNFAFAYYAELVTVPTCRTKRDDSVSINIDGRKTYTTCRFRREMDFWSPNTDELEKHGIRNVINLNSSGARREIRKNVINVNGQKIYLGDIDSYLPKSFKKKIYPTYFDIDLYEKMIKESQRRTSISPSTSKNYSFTQ